MTVLPAEFAVTENEGLRKQMFHKSLHQFTRYEPILKTENLMVKNYRNDEFEEGTCNTLGKASCESDLFLTTFSPRIKLLPLEVEDLPLSLSADVISKQAAVVVRGNISVGKALGKLESTVCNSLYSSSVNSCRAFSAFF